MQPTLTGYLAFLIAAEGCNAYTFRHSVNVADIAVTFGQALNLREPLIESIRIGSLLHDIGKLSISNEVLLKPGKLIAGELTQIHCHPVNGHQIVSPLDLNATERHIILFHHERWDGTGYPYGFAGEDIPLAARLVSLADAIDAMLSERPYRPAMNLRSVITEIHDQSGAQFDPNLAEISEKLVLKIVKRYKS